MSSFSGPALRAVRKLRGHTVADLAQLVDRTDWTIWSYEAGRAAPPLQMALRLADALQVPLETLLTASDDRRAG